MEKSIHITLNGAQPGVTPAYIQKKWKKKNCYSWDIKVQHCHLLITSWDETKNIIQYSIHTGPGNTFAKH